MYRIERDRYRQERNIFRAKYDHLKEHKEHLMSEDIKGIKLSNNLVNSIINMQKMILL